LFRYTGEDKTGERKAAKEYLQDWWGGVTRTIKSNPDEKVDGK
jgi:hypothetical protein